MPWDLIYAGDVALVAESEQNCRGECSNGRVGGEEGGLKTKVEKWGVLVMEDLCRTFNTLELNW